MCILLLTAVTTDAVDVMSSPSSSSSTNSSPHAAALADAAAAFDGLRLEDAAKKLSVLLDDPTTAPKIRASAWLLLGLTRAGQTEEAQAITAFTEALKLEPALDVPDDASPKVKELFALVRAQGAGLPASPTREPGATAASAKASSSPLDLDVPAILRIASAERAAERLEYDQAVEELQIVVADPQVSDEVKMKAHLLAGSIKRVTGNNAEARLHFMWVLRRNKDAVLVGPNAEAPKVQFFFELIREEVLLAQPTVTAVTSIDNPEMKPAWGALVGGGVGLLGITAMAVGGGIALANDIVVADVTQATEARRAARQSGIIGLGVASVGIILGGIGAGLMAMEMTPAD